MLARVFSCAVIGLDGGVRHVKGVLPMAALARQEGCQIVVVPVVNAPGRSAHHTISHVRLVCSGYLPKSGEISLAHQ
jgi:predicted ATPase with chaperone activity